MKKKEELEIRDERTWLNFFVDPDNKWKGLYLIRFTITNHGNKEVSLLSIDPFIRRYVEPDYWLKRRLYGFLRQLIGMDKGPKFLNFLHVSIPDDEGFTPEIGIRTLKIDNTINLTPDQLKAKDIPLREAQKGFDGITDLQFNVSSAETKRLTLGFIFDCYKEGKLRFPKGNLNSFMFNFRLLFDNEQEHEVLQGKEF